MMRLTPSAYLRKLIKAEKLEQPEFDGIVIDPVVGINEQMVVDKLLANRHRRHSKLDQLFGKVSTIRMCHEVTLDLNDEHDEDTPNLLRHFVTYQTDVNSFNRTLQHLPVTTWQFFRYQGGFAYVMLKVFDTVLKSIGTYPDNNYGYLPTECLAVAVWLRQSCISNFDETDKLYEVESDGSLRFTPDDFFRVNDVETKINQLLPQPFGDQINLALPESIILRPELVRELGGWISHPFDRTIYPTNNAIGYKLMDFLNNTNPSAKVYHGELNETFGYESLMFSGTEEETRHLRMQLGDHPVESKVGDRVVVITITHLDQLYRKLFDAYWE